MKTLLRLSIAGLLVIFGCGREAMTSDSEIASAGQSTPMGLEATGANANWLLHQPSDFRRMKGDASTPIIGKYNPSAVTHCLNGNNVVLGFNAYGGGYINFAHYRKNAKNVSCSDVKLGKYKNEANAGFGRGWQSSLRDAFHSNRYNPTQAGFMDGAGRLITGIKKDSTARPGFGNIARLAIPRFSAPLFSDPVFDFTHFEDLHPDFRIERPGEALDTDRINIPQSGGKDGSNQDQEVRSEFDFAGATEVWSDAVGVGQVDVFRHSFDYIYERDPSAILQFGSDARDEDKHTVVNDASRLKKLSAGAKGGKVKETDLSVATVSFGIRFGYSEGFDTVMWADKSGTLKSRSLSKEPLKLLAENGGDLKMGEDLDRKNIGGGTDGDAYGSFAMLCKGCTGKGARRAWALYVAPKSRTNRNQSMRRGGGEALDEDRRIQTHLIAQRAGEGKGMTNVNGGSFESSLHKLTIRTYTKGLYAPDRTGKGVTEGVRQEVFILHGNPEEIVKAIKRIDTLLGL